MLFLLPQAIASGIVTGCVYALIALAIVIVFKSTDVVNFAGGELVMIGAYIGLLCIVYFGARYDVMVVVVLAAMILIGCLFQRITLEKITGRRFSASVDLVPLVVATIGFSYMLKGIVRIFPYTEEVRRLPPLVSGAPIFIGPVILQWQDVAILVATMLVMGLLTYFFQFSESGKALRATSQNPRAAALSGIPVARMRMLAWALASAISGLAGILLAPKLLMTPDMGGVVMLAFAAAIVGGFTSLPGAVVGGIVIGIVQNVIGVLMTPQAISVTPFFIIMVVLVLRPQGLFGDIIALKKV
ncbi:MAG TPA: branched-chain amino acid ABC transporter permease [Pseudolabrys sp.]|nr:branched-chain amino acid ABC transporter permease [Pseudolabrys sp.]